jgi:NAD(P)-dependent dehydrogenase (short-subunit alcohol dehydrogenase family)
MASKAVIVTGAGGALGSAVVAHFAATGLEVVAFHRTQDEVDGALRATGVTHLAVDLLDETSVAAGMSQAFAQSTPPEGLVCLAGGFFGDVPIVDTSPQRLRDQFELNVMTAYTCIHAALPYFLDAGGGAIVGVGSRPALQTVDGAVAYGIAKAGVVKLIEQVAGEYRDRGIRANAVIPSIMDTPANRTQMPNADFTRWVRLEEVAAVLRFLVSDGASIVSGATIPIYGRT